MNTKPFEVNDVLINDDGYTVSFYKVIKRTAKTISIARLLRMRDSLFIYPSKYLEIPEYKEEPVIIKRKELFDKYGPWLRMSDGSSAVLWDGKRIYYNR